MVATKKSPTTSPPAPAEKPLWQQWKRRFLDGYITTAVRDEVQGRPYSMKIGVGNEGSTFCGCCGAASFREGPNPRGFSIEAHFGRAWAEREGVYLGANQDAKTLMERVEIKDAEFIELQDGEKVHNLIWRKPE